MLFIRLVDNTLKALTLISSVIDAEKPLPVKVQFNFLNLQQDYVRKWKLILHVADKFYCSINENNLQANFNFEEDRQA